MVVTTLQKHRIEYGIQGGGGLGAVAGGAVEADQGGAGVVRLGHRPEVQRPLRSGFYMNNNIHLIIWNCQIVLRTFTTTCRDPSTIWRLSPKHKLHLNNTQSHRSSHTTIFWLSFGNDITNGAGQPIYSMLMIFNNQMLNAQSKTFYSHPESHQ